MLEYLLDGGILMPVLLGLSIVGLAVVIDRWQVFKIANIDTSVMRRMILQLLAAGKPEDAIRLCEETKGPVAAILLVGLTRYQKLMTAERGQEVIKDSVSKSMEDYAPHVISALEKRINLLLMVGSIAPLVGMTGTVTGMIRAFGAMGEAGSLQGSVVASGIAEALITTAAGLLIAVPAVIFYNVFSNKLEQYTSKIEESATELVDFIHLTGSKTGAT